MKKMEKLPRSVIDAVTAYFVHRWRKREHDLKKDLMQLGFLYGGCAFSPNPSQKPAYNRDKDADLRAIADACEKNDIDFEGSAGTFVFSRSEGGIVDSVVIDSSNFLENVTPCRVRRFENHSTVQNVDS